MQSVINSECSICFQNIEDKFVLDCEHEFCTLCIKKHVKTQLSYKYKPTCPICRNELSQNEICNLTLHIFTFSLDPSKEYNMFETFREIMRKKKMINGIQYFQRKFCDINIYLETLHDRVNKLIKHKNNILCKITPLLSIQSLMQFKKAVSGVIENKDEYNNICNDISTKQSEMNEIDKEMNRITKILQRIDIGVSEFLRRQRQNNAAITITEFITRFYNYTIANRKLVKVAPNTFQSMSSKQIRNMLLSKLLSR